MILMKINHVGIFLDFLLFSSSFIHPKYITEQCALCTSYFVLRESTTYNFWRTFFPLSPKKNWIWMMMTCSLSSTNFKRLYTPKISIWMTVKYEQKVYCWVAIFYEKFPVSFFRSICISWMHSVDICKAKLNAPGSYIEEVC